MRHYEYYEYLENLERETERLNEEEVQIFDEDDETLGKPYKTQRFDKEEEKLGKPHKKQIFGNLYDSLDGFYDICSELKATLEALRALEKIGDDVTEAIKITKNRVDILTQDAKINLNLSDEEIENIKNDILGEDNRKIR